MDVDAEEGRVKRGFVPDLLGEGMENSGADGALFDWPFVVEVGMENSGAGGALLSTFD